MLIGAVIGFILWALLTFIIVGSLGKNQEIDYYKVTLLFMNITGAGAAIGYLISRI